MKILLIVPVLVLVPVIILLWPLEVAVRLADGCLSVGWRPLPGCGVQVRLFGRRVEPPELIAALAAGDLDRAVDVLLAGRADDKPKNAENAEKPTKNAKFERLLLREVLPGVASALHIRDLRVRVALGGDPFHAAMLGGAFQAAMHTLFARISHLTASWRVDVARLLEVGLLPQPAAFGASRIAVDCRVRFCAGRVLAAVVGRIVGRIIKGK